MLEMATTHCLPHALFLPALLAKGTKYVPSVTKEMVFELNVVGNRNEEIQSIHLADVSIVSGIGWGRSTYTTHSSFQEQPGHGPGNQLHEREMLVTLQTQ